MPVRALRDSYADELQALAKADRGPAVRIDPQRCEERAAACERLARVLRDPIARDIYGRAALRWRSTAEESEERLSYVVRLFAPPSIVKE